MHYYTHNIGDFASATRMLGPLEIGIAQILLDEYARTEKPLASDFIEIVSQSVASRYPAVSESLASGYVSLALRSLFEKTEAGYVCPMLDEQLKKYSERAERNRINASKPRKSKVKSLRDSEISESLASGERVANESLATNKPITKNQEPIHTPLPPLQGEEAERTEAASPSKAARKRGERLSIEALPEEWRRYCEQEDPDLDPDRVWADFRDYWTSKAGSNAVKLDWCKTWQTNVRSYRDAPDWKRKPVLKTKSKRQEVNYDAWLTGEY